MRRESPIRSFLDLRDSSWVYYDPCSLSGYYNLLKKLTEVDEDERFFDRVCCSGSHLESMGTIRRGEADAAAIDSNVLRLQLKSSPELGEQLRVVESWGPFPIQPVMVRSDLQPELRERLCAALLTLEVNSHVSPPSPDSGWSGSHPSPTNITPPKNRPCRSASAC